MYPGESSKSLHIGIDIVAKKGTPITSITAGTVVFAGEDARGGGLMVSVKSYHRGGAYVNHKTILGRVGSTGRSTGPHLHIEMAIVRNGKKPKYDDPSKYLCAYKKKIQIPHFKVKKSFTLKEDKPIFLKDLEVNNLESKGKIIK